MRALQRHGMADAIRERVKAGRPLLGLCIGMQILFDAGDEGPADGLGLIQGRVTKFARTEGLRVPHMGWNQVKTLRAHPLLQDGYYYFCHSYRPTGVPDENILAETEHGDRFASAVAIGACAAVQFHPEKSQRAGLGLISRFCSWAP